jgi:hypothetical protein
LDAHNITLWIHSEDIRNKMILCVEALIKEGKTKLPLILHVNPDWLHKEHPPGKGHIIFFEPTGQLPQEKIASLQQMRETQLEKGDQLVLMGAAGFDYLELARNFNIGNIIIEDNFDSGMLAAIIRKLLGDNFFGFEPFFPNGYTHFYHEYEFYGPLVEVFNPVTTFKDFTDTLQKDQKVLFQSFVSELMVNAISYAVYGITPEERDQKLMTPPAYPEIPKEQSVFITVAQDSEKYGIGIRDRSGSLTLKRVLEKIRRHSVLDENQLPIGLTDNTGRGLFILSRNTRLVVNILQGVQTEILLMHFQQKELNKYQSLIINEKRSTIGAN